MPFEPRGFVTDIDCNETRGRAGSDGVRRPSRALNRLPPRARWTGYGLCAETLLAERHPGLVAAQLCAWGWTGPWAGAARLRQPGAGGPRHRLDLEAGPPTERPGALPAQALDHGTGYLLAAAVLRALTDARRHSGGRLLRLQGEFRPGERDVRSPRRNCSCHVATCLSDTPYFRATSLRPMPSGERRRHDPRPVRRLRRRQLPLRLLGPRLSGPVVPRIAPAARRRPGGLVVRARRRVGCRRPVQGVDRFQDRARIVRAGSAVEGDKARSSAARSVGAPCAGSTMSTGSSSSGTSLATTSSRVTWSRSPLVDLSALARSRRACRLGPEAPKPLDPEHQVVAPPCRGSARPPSAAGRPPHTGVGVALVGEQPGNVGAAVLPPARE